MDFVAWSILILALTGIAAWTIRGRPDWTAFIGAGGCLVGGGLGLWGVGGCLFHAQLESRRELWNVPFGSLSMGVDTLSAVFLLPVFLIGAMAALAAARRSPGDYATNHPHEHWLFFNLTLSAAALAGTARNAVLFLFAWETMTVCSFLLVENRQRESGARSGGWAYLTAGHIGGACLFAMFALLGSSTGNFDFSSFKAPGGLAAAVFLLAIAGFGGKIGLFPFHAWYPEAYPRSPAHVGAILSGVIGNLGVYGLFRILRILGGDGPPPAWWGGLLLFTGLASGVIGAARSLGSRDLFRLLAWSSLENYGLMAAGLGLGLLGATTGNAAVSFLGFTASVFHMLNHAVSKALLFLSAGQLTARSGTRDLNAMGGLLKCLPAAGTLFLVGSLGAAAVPPLNGFASEFLLLMAAYSGAAGYQPASVAAAAMVAAIVLLAVISGLAIAAYIKAFGFIFLGAARGTGAASGGAERRRQLIPHFLLALTALGLAALSPYVLLYLKPIGAVLVRTWRQSPTGMLDLETWLALEASNPLWSAYAGSWLLAACLALTLAVRLILLRRKNPRTGPTWDCGYAAPNARMQYTASSFARPLLGNFRDCAPFSEQENMQAGIFPTTADFASTTPGLDDAWGFSRLFKTIARLAARLRVLQAGRVQMYILYMAGALLILLLWKL